MSKTTCRVVLQKDLSYGVEMDVGKSVRTIIGFTTEDDARAWAARANLQEKRSVDMIARPERRRDTAD
ncbi:hypothetical protein SAMN05444161_1210 [Rhizobiales bacterium GAS191]|jgi:hypothetical protein|nr:hypothetical protein SAMN05519103_00244 [Rhizobiales bacterium GAS113]SEC47693.1 hypothetical protein SAMN05444161_1210 [Rhizobiales bacterium GAS191]SEC78670.1 hypothetical protein SAMN05519104_2088 [Rhizobiales bacterium GAS188]